MKNRRIKLVVLLGLIAIAGIVVLQVIWLKEAFDYEAQKFGQKAHVALLEVVQNIYEDKQQVLPASNPVNQVSKDYYIVNINSDFEASMLDFYLRKAFERAGLFTDFEYAMYQCETDEMVYGNYISYNSDKSFKRSSYFPTNENLVYYFAVRFPARDYYFVASQWRWMLLSGVLLVILFIYVYSIFVLLQQKRLSELQTDFINNMTHEFKTPLSSILIASNFLSKQPSIKEDTKLSTYTQSIIDQGQRLNAHVEKVLQLAKSGSNALKLNRQKLDLGELLQSVKAAMEVKHPNAEIRIQPITNTVHIHADEVHFTNVLYNLLENGIKYNDKSPEIDIALQQVGEAWELSVSDNGRGIAKKHQKQIFKQFFRVPYADHQHKNGFGLGLYYVKKICELHGWDITVESEGGEGSCFCILMK